MKPTDILSAEHRVIEQVVRCLLEMAAEATATRTLDDAAATDTIAFVRTFADRCHHKKEEDILFARLVRRGFSTESGPVAVMLHEHELGRRHVDGLEAALSGFRSRRPGAIDEFARIARAFADLLLQHIAKEDQVLFPLAEQMLSEEDREEVLRSFTAAESGTRAEEHERMIAIADRLGAAFGVTRSAQRPALLGCCHH